MTSSSMLILAVAFICGLGAILTEALQDGDIYKFTSVLDERALTVGNSEPDAGSKITLEPWQDESSQKWLAVEAVVAGDNYLLVPRRQKWDWTKFVNEKDSGLKDRHNSLPDFTLALNVDKNQNVSQEFRDSKPGQQWRSIRIEGKSFHIIKNIKTDRCLKNPGEPKKSGGVFSRIKQAGQILARGTEKPKQPKFAQVELAVCDKKEPGQQWNVDKL